MSKLLYIEASPRGSRSYSTRLAEAFLESYKKSHATDEVRRVNVFEMKLPAFDGFVLQAKYNIMHGKDHSQQEKEAWRQVEAMIEQFTGADKYLLSAPMWNFGIPYRLKQYIDILVQPGYTFSFSPEEGYKGLMTGRKMCICYARGGKYPAGSDAAAMDMQKSYLELILGFIGITPIKSVIVEPTLAEGAEAAQGHLERAMAEARKISVDF